MFLLRDRFYGFGIFLPLEIAGYRDWIAAAKRAEHGVVPDIFAAIFTVTFHKASSPLKLASVDIVVPSHDFVQQRRQIGISNQCVFVHRSTSSSSSFKYSFLLVYFQQ